MGNRLGLPEGTIREWNGYSTIKKDGQWRYTHHVIAEEEVLHRPLMRNEMVFFKDNDRTNLDPSNLMVKLKKPNRVFQKREMLRRRIRESEARLNELKGQLAALDEQLDRMAKRTALPPEAPEQGTLFP